MTQATEDVNPDSIQHLRRRSQKPAVYWRATSMALAAPEATVLQPTQFQNQEREQINTESNVKGLRLTCTVRC